MRPRIFLFFMALMLAATPVLAAPNPFGVSIGANGVWFNDEARPSDFELGGTASLSLQPHIAVVGGGWYGVNHSYLRATVGPRITVTDPNYHAMSVGVGIEYQVSSKEVLRSEEWSPTVSLGFMPWEGQPRIVVGAQGAWGLDTNEASFLVGARYAIGGYE